MRIKKGIKKIVSLVMVIVFMSLTLQVSLFGPKNVYAASNTPSSENFESYASGPYPGRQSFGDWTYSLLNSRGEDDLIQSDGLGPSIEIIDPSYADLAPISRSKAIYFVGSLGADNGVRVTSNKGNFKLISFLLQDYGSDVAYNGNSTSFTVYGYKYGAMVAQHNFQAPSNQEQELQIYLNESGWNDINEFRIVCNSALDIPWINLCLDNIVVTDPGYTVTYDGNGSTSGVLPTDSVSYNSGTAVTAKASGNLSKTGYTFAGWNTAQNGTGIAVAAGGSFNISNNTILYAQWNEIVPASGLTVVTTPENPAVSGKVNLTVTPPAVDSNHKVYYRAVDLVPTALNVGDVITPSGWTEVTDANAHEITVSNGKYIEAVEVTTADNKVTRWGKSSATADGYIPSASLNTNTAGFDKNILNQSDVSVFMTTNGNTLMNITNAGIPLFNGADYTVMGDMITISRRYLSSLTTGTTANLVFNFDGGRPQSLSVTILDTTPRNSSLSIEASSFDKNTSNQADINVSMTLNGNFLTNIVEGLAPLVNGMAYTVNGNIVTINKRYLSTLGIGTTVLTFNFSAGSSQRLFITVTDTTPIVASGLTVVTTPENPAVSGKVNLTVTPAVDSDHKVYYRAADLVPTALNIGDVITPSDWIEVTDTNAHEITVSNGKYIEAVEVTTADNKVTRWGKSSATADGYIPSASLNTNTAGFDKNILNQADVSVFMMTNGNTLMSITNAGIPLFNGEDYAVMGDMITISRRYLSSLTTGTTANLVFNFDGGRPQSLSVTILDTTPRNSSLSIEASSFDKNTSNQADINVSMTLNGNFLTNIVEGLAPLVNGMAYTVNGNIVTINKRYLSTLGIGTTVLTFNFSAGSSQRLFITVTDTTPIVASGLAVTTTAEMPAVSGKVNLTVTPPAVDSDHKVYYRAADLVPTALNIGDVITPSDWTEVTDANAHEITVPNGKYIEAVEVTAADNKVTRWGKSSATADGYIPSASLNTNTAGFDKNISNQANISVGMMLNGNMLTSIMNGVTPLINGMDYIASTNMVVISKSYLGTLSTGMTTLVFNFSQGAPQSLNVMITDTTPVAASGLTVTTAAEMPAVSGKVNLTVTPPAVDSNHKVYYRAADLAPAALNVGDVITPSDWTEVTDANAHEITVANGKYIEAVEVTAADNKVTRWGKSSATADGYIPSASLNTNTAGFDKNISNQANISVGMMLNGNMLTSIMNGVTPLINGMDYIASTNMVVISKSYLGTLSTGMTTLVFNFSQGAPQSLNVMITDTTCYTVTFKDYDGSTIGTPETVNYGGGASAPTNPTRTGYTFTGWDKTFNNVTGNLEVTAQYSINRYTVTFKDYDGSTIGTPETVNYGGRALAPVNPTRTGYTFTGWDKTFDNVTGNLVVTAQYSINSYTVTFKDYDGSTIGTPETVNYGGRASAPANPTRTGYTFTGWDKTFGNVTGNLVVTAQYSINSYTVTFKNYDGSTIGIPQNVNYGGRALAPVNPTRTGYTFTGWDKAFDNITGNLVVAAQYSINRYTVTFKDYDGSTIGTPQTVNYEGNASAPTNPTRTGYTFTGWDKTFDNVTGNLVVTAQYSINGYTVTFKDYDGSTIGTPQTVNYGGRASAPTNPTRTGYTFTGWDKTFDNVTGNLVVTAQYSINGYTVTFKNYDGSTIGTPQTVNYGGKALAPGVSARTGYTFTGWDKAFDSITGNLVVTAQYSINRYTVTFKNYDGSTIGIPQTVNYGGKASAPVSPTRTGYIFAGWDKVFDNVMEDLVVTATYTSGNTYDFPSNTSSSTSGNETKISTDYLKSRDNTLVINNSTADLAIPASAIDLTDGADHIKVTEKVVTSASNNNTLGLFSNVPNGVQMVGNPLSLNIQLFDAKDKLIKDIHQFANNQKVKVTIKLTADQVKGLDTSKLSMYYYDEANKEWVELGGTFDPNSMEFTFYTPHFTNFAIMQKVTAASTNTNSTIKAGSNNASSEKELPKTGSIFDFYTLLGIGVILIASGIAIFRRKKIS